MNPRTKTGLIVLLTLTTISTGIFAWQQNRALRELRAAHPSSDDKERAALLKRLTDAEHRAHDLQNELDALKSRMTSDEPPPPDDQAPNNAGNGDRPRFRDRGGPGGFMALMNDPKIAKVINAREKMMLDSTYAALFKSLSQGGTTNLTAEQLDTFKNLLVEKENTVRDVMMTARAQGITDRTEINQLVKSAQADLDTQIQSTLGADGYTQYQEYEKTLPQRSTVNLLSQSLSYTSTPLTDAQSQQLIQLLADTTNSTDANSRRNQMGPGGGPGGPGGFGIGATITDAAVTQAQSILSTDQVQALVSLQQQQKAQDELMQSMRAERQQTNAAGSSTTAK